MPLRRLGLNILTGYCGAGIVGHRWVHGGWGLCSVYKLMVGVSRGLHRLIHVLLAGGITACVGVLFGLPSCASRGFIWRWPRWPRSSSLYGFFNKVPWFYNYSASGQINAPERSVFGIIVTGPNTEAWAKYLICLVFVVVLACGRAQSDARHDGTQVDGHSRYGHRCRDHRGEPIDG